MSPPTTTDDKREEFEAVVGALNARDFDALAEILHPEVEFHSRLAVAEGEVYRGIEGTRQWAVNVDATWDGFEMKVMDFRMVGDQQAVAVLRNLGVARASGVPLQTSSAAVLTWRDGKPWRNVVYSDTREALAAVGLSE